MIDFIKELFCTDFCEVSKYHCYSQEVLAAQTRKERAFSKLENTLEKENLELFKSYISAESNIKSEEIFHAYCCGMRDFIRILASLFDEGD